MKNRPNKIKKLSLNDKMDGFYKNELANCKLIPMDYVEQTGDIRNKALDYIDNEIMKGLNHD